MALQRIKNFDENHGVTDIIIFGSENGNGGERGIRTPQNSVKNNGNPPHDAQRDSQISVPSSSE